MITATILLELFHRYVDVARFFVFGALHVNGRATSKAAAAIVPEYWHGAANALDDRQ